MDTIHTSIPCSIMRGGTSKAVFFQQSDIIETGISQDELLRYSVDAYNLHAINGVGGGAINTSKVVIVATSARPDADIECEFVQVGLGDNTLSYEIFCGNICSAVGPYAVDKQLVHTNSETAHIRIFNKNINKLVDAYFQVASTIDWVGQTSKKKKLAYLPETPILLDFKHTISSDFKDIFPSGKYVNTLHLSNGRSFEVTLMSIINPCVFIHAAALGVSGFESAETIATNKALMETLHEIRSVSAPYFNLETVWNEGYGRGPMLPYAVIVSPPGTQEVSGKHPHLEARAVHLKTCHPSLPASVSIPTAIASIIPETLPYYASCLDPNSDVISIGHPQGKMDVSLTASWDSLTRKLSLKHIGYSRTARKILDGETFIPSFSSETLADRHVFRL